MKLEVVESCVVSDEKEDRQFNLSRRKFMFSVLLERGEFYVKWDFLNKILL